MEFIKDIALGIWENSGFSMLFTQEGGWKYAIMILVAFVFLYLAIAKKFEPLLLVPIAFGILLANMPGAGMMADPTGIMDTWHSIRILILTSLKLRIQQMRKDLSRELPASACVLLVALPAL